MFYVLGLTQFCIFKTQFYTKTKVLLKPSLKSSVIPPIEIRKLVTGIQESESVN